MQKRELNAAMRMLAERFHERDWSYYDVPTSARGRLDAGGSDIMYHWHAGEDDVQVCVFRGKRIGEELHRQDFFFLNFAYSGGYTALSGDADNLIEVRENECYIGQPYSSYALRDAIDGRGCTIIGVLVKRDAFLRSFLPVLSTSPVLFRFFVETRDNEFSYHMMRVRFDASSPVRDLLELMVCEYARPREDTQTLLRTLGFSVFLQVARAVDVEGVPSADERISDRVVRYLTTHPEVTTLKAVAEHFSYHPNYLSGVLRAECGRTFSQILLEQRMERAQTLLSVDDLRVDEVAAMLGYHGTSNFYKAYRAYFGHAPRQRA